MFRLSGNYVSIVILLPPSSRGKGIASDFSLAFRVGGFLVTLSTKNIFTSEKEKNNFYELYLLSNVN